MRQPWMFTEVDDLALLLEAVVWKKILLGKYVHKHPNLKPYLERTNKEEKDILEMLRKYKDWNKDMELFRLSIAKKMARGMELERINRVISIQSEFCRVQIPFKIQLIPMSSIATCHQ